MSDAECPYCGEYQEINHDDGYGYEEDRVYEQECGNCEKTFSFQTSIMFSYSTAKSPCMNGEPHSFKPTHTAPKYHTGMCCEYCDERRKMTEHEWLDFMKPMEVISGYYY